MNKTRLEMTVGFFVILALIIFFIIVFFISGVYFLREGFHVKAHFDYVAGLDKGAPVQMAGVRVGEVNGVSISYDPVSQKPVAICDLWLAAETQIREDSKLYIMGTFALAESHIEIFSSGDSEGRLLQDGDAIHGVSPVPMEKLTERGLAMADDFENMAKKLNEVLGDEKLQEALQTTILDMSELLRYMNTMIEQRGTQINNSIDDIESTLARLSSILEQIDSGEGTLGKLLYDDELYEEMRALVREIKMHPWRLLKRDKKADEDGKFLGIF